MLATIIKWHRDKGIGFAQSLSDPMMPDVFIHFSNLRANETWNRKFLLAGMKVEFDLESDPDPNDPENPRLQAKRVRVVPPITIAIQRTKAVQS